MWVGGCECGWGGCERDAREHHTHTPGPPVGVWCDIHTPPVWGCGAGGGGVSVVGGGGVECGLGGCGQLCVYIFSALTPNAE